MIGELQPSEGSISRHSHLKIAYYNQHSEDQLDLEIDKLVYVVEEHAHTLKKALVNRYMGMRKKWHDHEIERIGEEKKAFEEELASRRAQPGNATAAALYSSSTTAAPASARNSRRTTLPVVVIGKASTKAISRGYSCADSRVRT